MQIGNAVPQPMARGIANILKKISLIIMKIQQFIKSLNNTEIGKGYK